MTPLKKVFNIILSIAALFAIAFALLWFVHTFDVFRLPAFIDDLFAGNKNDSDNLDFVEKNLISLIENESYFTPQYEYVELTTANAIEILSKFEKTESFYWEIVTVVSQNQSSRKQNHRIYKSDDRVRVDTIDDYTNITTIYSDDKTYILNNLSLSLTTYDGDIDFPYDEIINIATLETALKENEVGITNIATVEMDNEKYLYVEIPKSSFNGIDKYFISLDHGIVMIASSEINGVEYFSQKTASFDTESLISDRAFDINDLLTPAQPEHQ